MPLYVSMPLPGPLRYSTRVGGKGARNLAYLLFVAWWWLPIKWLFIAMYYLVALTVKASVWCVRGTVDYVRLVQHQRR